MSKQILLLAGAALLFAGAAQACAPEAQADQAHSTIDQNDAPAPAASVAEVGTVGSAPAKKVGQERSDDAKPVYLDGGYFGGSTD
jgi:hypothetical protein